MKEIKILVVIIIILAIIFGIKISGIKIFGEKSELTLDQVKEIVAKSENINNYIYKSDITGSTIIKKYKNNKEVIEYNVDDNNYKNYIDYEKNKNIIIEENKKIAIITKNTSTETMKNMKDKFEYLIEKSKEYKYVGEKDNCIIIELKYIEEQDSGEEIKIEIWINKEKGVITKQIEKSKGIKEITEYNYKFDCVSDEDVKVPDLSNYKVTEESK